MTIQECYAQMGADYNEVFRRLYNEAMIRKFVLLFPKDDSFHNLEAALKEIIAETGATSGKDMGKVMGVASKKLKDRHGCDTFSASGLSYDSEDLSFAYFKADVADSLDLPTIGMERVHDIF